jgi:hypothetical protein
VAALNWVLFMSANRLLFKFSEVAQAALYPLPSLGNLLLSLIIVKKPPLTRFTGTYHREEQLIYSKLRQVVKYIAGNKHTQTLH